MSGTHALPVLNEFPADAWQRGITAAPDPEAELERAREFGIAHFNEVELSHQLLDQIDRIDPDPEFAEALPTRLSRVLGLPLRPPAPED